MTPSYTARDPGESSADPNLTAPWKLNITYWFRVAKSPPLHAAAWWNSQKIVSWAALAQARGLSPRTKPAHRTTLVRRLGVRSLHLPASTRNL